MTLHVVTGASRGLGAAMLRQLLQGGHTAIACARGPAPRDLAGAPGLDWTSLDLGDPGQARHWVENRLAAARPLPDRAVLLLNAGMLEPVAAVAALDPAALDRHMRVNLTGQIAVASGFLAATADQGIERRILAISSGAARRGIPHWAAYCASKAGLDGFVRALNAEADPTLRAVSMAPGVVDTEMQAVVRAIPAPQRERFLRLHAEGRLDSPDRVAAALLAHLAGPEFGCVEIDDIRDHPRD